MNIKIILAWYDFWIGWYYDQSKKCLYIFPIPMIGIKIQGFNKCEDCGKKEPADSTNIKRRFGGALQCYTCYKDECNFEDEYR